jgi:Ribbon-helix-helix protein, copG family
MAAVKRASGKPVTTKAGTRLDAHVEQRLTEDAEAGLDPATLTRRHAGRPSLSGRAGHSNRVDLRVDDETYLAIRRIADQDNRNISDVVREAIRRFLETS